MNSIEFGKKIDKRKSEIRYIQDLLLKGGCCVICGYNKDPRILELHHIAGRKNCDIVIPVCPNCHRTLSMGQEPGKVGRGKDIKTDYETIGWRMDGYSLLLKLLSYNMKESSVRLLGED